MESYLVVVGWPYLGQGIFQIQLMTNRVERRIGTHGRTFLAHCNYTVHSLLLSRLDSEGKSTMHMPNDLDIVFLALGGDDALSDEEIHKHDG